MQSMSPLLIGALLVTLCGANPQFDFSGPPSPPGGGNGFGVPGGYLPPRTPTRVCPMTPHYATVTRTTQTTTTRFQDSPGRDSTTRVVSTQFRPTTIVQTVNRPGRQTTTRRVVSTQREQVVSTIVTTIGGVPVTRTIVKTNTRPTRVASTQYETAFSTKFVTRTSNLIDYTTVIRDRTITKDDVRYVTSTSVYKGPDATRVTTRTSNIVTTVRTQPPPRTIRQTRTVQSTQFTTSVYQPRPTVITRTETKQEIDRITRTTTLRDVITQTRRVTSTIGDIVTRTQTSVVGSTSIVAITSTRVTTRVQASTVYEDRLVTSTQSQRPVTRTSTVSRIVTKTGAGGENVITRTRQTTVFDNKVTTVGRVTGDRTKTVVKTTQQKCGQPTYTYEAPAVPFTFGK